MMEDGWNRCACRPDARADHEKCRHPQKDSGIGIQMNDLKELFLLTHGISVIFDVVCLLFRGIAHTVGFVLFGIGSIFSCL